MIMSQSMLNRFWCDVRQIAQIRMPARVRLA